MEAAYIKSHQDGSLHRKIDKAINALGDCSLCPRNCMVNRLEGELGFCRTARHAKVASFGPHFGEEAPLVGSHGSGTIFFASCNLLCQFCQNDDISHGNHGREVSPEQLANMMLSLQGQGCHNINLVTPSHVIPQFLEAMPLAIEKGLSVPIVYNTGGYDSVSTLQLLKGVVDIYMPDVKFLESGLAEKYCEAPDYPKVVQKAVKEMHAQVGDLEIEGFVALRGLLVRHLVMPLGQSTSQQVMAFLGSVSLNTYVNIMGQYHPCYHANDYPEIRSRPTSTEMDEAYQAAKDAGITRLDKQHYNFF